MAKIVGSTDESLSPAGLFLPSENVLFLLHFLLLPCSRQRITSANALSQ